MGEVKDCAKPPTKHTLDSRVRQSILKPSRALNLALRTNFYDWLAGEGTIDDQQFGDHSVQQKVVTKSAVKSSVSRLQIRNHMNEAGILKINPTEETQMKSRSRWHRFHVRKSYDAFEFPTERSEGTLTKQAKPG